MKINELCKFLKNFFAVFFLQIIPVFLNGHFADNHKNV